MTLDGTRTLNSRPLLILQLPFSLLSTHSVSRLLLACCCLSHTLAQIPSPTPASEPPPSKLTLPSVLQRVLVTDRNIAVADLEVRKAVVDKLRASSRMAPRLSFDTSSNWKGDATRRTQTVSGNSAPTGPSSGTAAPVAAFVPTLVRERRWTRTQANTQSLGLNITQPILDLTVRPARRQSELLEKITQFQLQQRLREVLFNVTAQYFEVLRQEELVEENKKTLGQTFELVRQAEGRLKAQEVIESDVLQARVSHQQAQRAVSEAENSRDLAKSQLAVTLDYLPDPTFTNETATAGKLAAPSLREAIQAARQQREEIQVTQLTWHRTQAERDEIRARFAPTMDLQLGSDVSTGSTLDRRDSWNAGISFSWAIFDRGQRLLDLKTNDLQLAQDDLQIQEASRTVSHDVVDAWYSVEKFRIRMESLVLERKAAEANYEVQEGKYKAGLATALEVQTALRDLARVRIENVGARFDLEIAYRDLENMLAQYETPRLTETVSRMTAARPASPLIILKNSTPNTKAP